MTHLAVEVGVPDEADATALSRLLVEERLAAGTRTASGTSHYRWEGTVHEIDAAAAFLDWIEANTR